MHHNMIRLGGLFGILPLVQGLVVSFVFDLKLPSSNMSVAELTNHFVHSNRAAYAVDLHTSVMFGVSVLIFYGVLRTAWNQPGVKEQASIWGWLADAGIILCAVFGMLTTILWESFTLTYKSFEAFKVLPPDIGLALVLYSAGNWAISYSTFIFGLAAISIAVIALKTGVIVKWIGWITMIVGVIAMIGYFNPNTFILMLLWYPILGLVMLIAPGHIIPGRPSRQNVTGL
ncbi:hypothetical protein [Legionella impletisoli]|uniref:DUF4386 family protein n=1 Tax=Legionella impletisoli TaxID=343510 RepID=A0A917JQ95_9GAMM|nr:hypothetical protein [Legionella impletisoli]GGI78244.1 hypothetical protein GCM10007966_03670 [Legionella impletisoli]